MKRVAMMLVCGVVALGASRATAQTITQEELVRRTQELMDSVAAGNQEPWKKYYADDALFFDEKGRNMDKAALVKDIAPLPAGYSGTIKVTNPQSRIFPDVAILSYDADETETVFGQAMTARYHSTDTWMRRGGQWQIVASQTLRYYEDPAAGKVDPAKLRDYVGMYELAPKVTMQVSDEADQLYSQRSGRAKELLIPEAPDIFFRKGVEGRRLFRRNENGKVDALIDRRNNEDIVWKKVN
jgi:ketosteroid isomerase-like protein